MPSTTFRRKNCRRKKKTMNKRKCKNQRSRKMRGGRGEPIPFIIRYSKYTDAEYEDDIVFCVGKDLGSNIFNTKMTQFPEDEPSFDTSDYDTLEAIGDGYAYLEEDPYDNPAVDNIYVLCIYTTENDVSQVKQWLRDKFQEKKLEYMDNPTRKIRYTREGLEILLDNIVVIDNDLLMSIVNADEVDEEALNILPMIRIAKSATTT